MMSYNPHFQSPHCLQPLFLPPLFIIHWGGGGAGPALRGSNSFSLTWDGTVEKGQDGPLTSYF